MTYLLEADRDWEARNAIWGAIQIAAEKLPGYPAVYLGTRPTASQRVGRQASMPTTIPTWRLVEGLCLLAVLSRADSIDTPFIPNFLGKNDPIPYTVDGKQLYIRSQALLQSAGSGFGAIPDLLVTTTEGIPTPESTVRIIEAKCRRQFGAQDVRAEFGKAHDLQCRSYFIWLYYSPSARLRECALALGIELGPLGFDSGQRAMVLQPENLFHYVSNELKRSDKEARFAKGLIAAGEAASRKLATL